MVAKNGKTVLSYGVMGGAYQAFGHMQFLSRYLDYGLDIQEAMDLPRFFPDINTGTVQVEAALGDEVIMGLAKARSQTSATTVTCRRITGDLD